MKHRQLLLSLAGLVALAATSQAAPVPGVYQSVDNGGALLLGRASQSWVAPFNANGGDEDVFNSQSWDGSTLGTQWGFSCGEQMGQQSIVDGRDVNGTGFVTFTNVFQGGVFYLNPGPWGSGPGTLSVTTNQVIAHFTAYMPDAPPVVNITSSGQFDNSNCILSFTLANAVGRGDTDAGPFPADYPALLDNTAACAATRQYGSWGDVSDITMGITCTVPTESQPWGSVKSIYR